MSQQQKVYDIAIAGGGLAGLSLAIQSAQAGYSVILVEKEIYPFNRVCGEYISMESWGFIKSLGVPLNSMHLPQINNVVITGPDGTTIKQALDMGGFGISRYMLDNYLYTLAKSAGVAVVNGTKVDAIDFDGTYFTVTTAAQKITAHTAVGCFGKRSNLDVKWHRSFIKKNNRLNNYIGVKYHIKTTAAADVIALHNFENGYCGISKIEDDKYCLCYLTTAKNLKHCGNSITQLENVYLKKNPYLKNILNTAEKLFTPAVTIAQISFSKKTQVENNVLLIGDAAGMITPLCGNGMSMALHGSKIAFEAIDQFLKKAITREQMEFTYKNKWNKEFANRLFAGRLLQQCFGKTWVTNIFLKCLKPFPSIINWLIKQTHGHPF